MSEVLNIKSPKRTVFWLLVFLFPPTIGLGLVYYSAAQGLTMGFTNWNIISAPKWIGLKNFEQIWNDYRFWLAVSNTLFIVLVTVPAQIGLGLLAAVLLHRIKGKTSDTKVCLLLSHDLFSSGTGTNVDVHIRLGRFA